MNKRPAQPQGTSGKHVDDLELILSKQQWVGGAEPKQADYLAILSMKGQAPSPQTHPFTFGWYSFASKFNEQIQKSWPAK